MFGSFGWSGEAVDEMEAKLKDGGYGFAFNPIKVKFKPTTKVSGSGQAGITDRKQHWQQCRRPPCLGLCVLQGSVVCSAGGLSYFYWQVSRPVLDGQVSRPVLGWCIQGPLCWD